MSRMMIQAAVTMGQLQNKLDVIGNNLANSQTTGYKSHQSEFSSLLFQQINNLNHPQNATGRLTPDGLRVGSGAKLGSINLNTENGAIMQTDRELDVALLQKNHYFQVEVTENNQTQIQYTRDGSFYLQPINNNQSLLLTTKDGHPVYGMNGPIEIAPGFDQININDQGQIVVKRGDVTAVEGQLAVVDITRPRLLEAAGDNLFRLPDLQALGIQGEIIQLADLNESVIQSGALETSNVDLSKEMTDLLIAQRSYQFNARTISMGDQMLGLINQLR